MKRLVVGLLFLSIIFNSFACGLRSRTSGYYDGGYSGTEKPFQYAFDAFDTQCSISIYGVEDENQATEYYYDMKRLIDNYENVFSKTKKDSQVYEINHRQGDSVMICDELAAIFDIAKDFYTWSGKSFDVSSGTLIDLWDVKNRKTLPTLEEINEARKHCANFSYTIERNVADGEFRNNKIIFSGDSKTQYDFGALVKGYCCDALREMLYDNEDITACIINLGGNVLCTGEVNNRPKGRFNIGIFKPFSENEIIETVSVKNKNVITSGNYQRYFKIDGDDRIYHHIIDPETGYPSNSGLDSVTIISDNGLLGDYLSTTCMLLGEDDSKSLIDFAAKSFSDKKIQAIYVHSDGTVTKYPRNVKFD